MPDKPTCPHCGHKFGYLIDGVFHPVKWCGHKINGEVWIFEPGKAPRKRDAKRKDLIDDNGERGAGGIMSNCPNCKAMQRHIDNLRAENERLAKERDDWRVRAETAWKALDAEGAKNVDDFFGLRELEARAQSAEAALAELRESAVKLLRGVYTFQMRGIVHTCVCISKIDALRSIVNKEGE